MSTRTACARALFCLFACAPLAGCDTLPRRVEIPVAAACVEKPPLPVELFTDAELSGWAAVVADTKRPFKERDKAAANFVGAIKLDRAALIRAVAARDALLRACSKLAH